VGKRRTNRELNTIGRRRTKKRLNRTRHLLKARKIMRTRFRGGKFKEEGKKISRFRRHVFEEFVR